jgi:uncharacterized membrane protein
MSTEQPVVLRRVGHLNLLEPNPVLGEHAVERAEHYPYGLLTMIVSLEAIFLSTFVMISQNRADAKRQIIADQQWQTVKEEDKQNEELLDLSRQILELTKSVHAYAAARAGGVSPPPSPLADA